MLKNNDTNGRMPRVYPVSLLVYRHYKITEMIEPREMFQETNSRDVSSGSY